MQEFGPEVITVLARRLLDPHHLCADIFHYCPRNSGRAPAEIPCNATRSWAAAQGLISEPEKGSALLRELGSEEVYDGDEWGGGRVSEVGGIKGQWGELNSISGSESKGSGATEGTLRVGHENEFDTEGSKQGHGYGGNSRKQGPGESQDVQHERTPSRSVRQQKQFSQEGQSKFGDRQEEAVGHFLQLTDIHLDLEYVEGSEVSFFTEVFAFLIVPSASFCVFLYQEERRLFLFCGGGGDPLG